MEDEYMRRKGMGRGEDEDYRLEGEENRRGRLGRRSKRRV